MKYRSIVLAGLLTTLVGCSAPRGHHNYRGKMTHSQMQQRLDRIDRMPNKNKRDDMRRGRGKGRENE